jgi:hypothetical protein
MGDDILNIVNSKPSVNPRDKKVAIKYSNVLNSSSRSVSIPHYDEGLPKSSRDRYRKEGARSGANEHIKIDSSNKMESGYTGFFMCKVFVYGWVVFY